MPLPSSTMVEVGVRMLCVQRGLSLVLLLLVVVVLLESHSAMRGVIFQRTVVYYIILDCLMVGYHWFQCKSSPAPVVPPALEDDNRVGD